MEINNSVLTTDEVSTETSTQLLQEKLRAQRLRPFLLACRNHGRAHIDEKLRSEMTEIYKALLECKNDKNDLLKDKATKLAFQFLKIEYNIYLNLDLNYNNYLNLEIIESFIENDTGVKSLARTRLALIAIVADWLKFEERGKKKNQNGNSPHGYSPAHVDKRILALKKLGRIISIQDLPVEIPVIENWLPQNDVWEELANSADGLKALVLLSALPQSRYHDEMMFIRITQLAECCFIAIISAISIIKQDFKTLTPKEACGLAKEASSFVSLLLHIYSTIFRTLPYENFYSGFRPETGESSAIQSRNYQILDGMIRGLGDLKRKTLKSQPLVNNVPNLPEMSGVFLKTLRDLVKADNRWKSENTLELDYYLSQISKNFSAWRTFHLGIARTYLPKMAHGTGGMGISYLEKTRNSPEEIDLSKNVRKNTSIRSVLYTLAANKSKQREQLYWMQFSNFDFQKVIFAFDSSVQETPTGAINAFLEKWQVKINAGILLQDSMKIVGDIWVDNAMPSEHFINREGKTQTFRSGEAIVRDRKGIILGSIQGSSRRTFFHEPKNIDEFSSNDYHPNIELSISFRTCYAYDDAMKRIGLLIDAIRPHCNGIILSSIEETKVYQ